jgi:hypothetical protein
MRIAPLLFAALIAGPCFADDFADRVRAAIEKIGKFDAEAQNEGPKELLALAAEDEDRVASAIAALPDLHRRLRARRS